MEEHRNRAHRNPETESRELAIGDIEFLARSVNRIDALRALAERPRSRTELQVVTGASSSTVCRLLREFDARNWVDRDGHRYRTTELGGFVAAEFEGLVGRMATERTLYEIARWFSFEPAFDLTCLADAEITLPSRSDPFAPIMRVGELVGSAARLRVLTYNFPESCFVPMWQAVMNGTQQCDLVTTPEAIEAVAESACAPRFEAVRDAERASVYVYDGEIPQIFGINDDVVHFGIDDEKGTPLALIETTDETVVSWAEETFDSYRHEAQLLSPDAIEA